MEEQTNSVTEQTEQPKVSRLATLRHLLSDENGYTKQELADATGLKLSTVNCQIYYHLKNKGLVIEKLETGKYRFAN